MRESRWCEGRRRRGHYPLEVLATELANERLDEAVRAGVQIAREEFERQLAEAIAKKEVEIEREGRTVESEDELRDPIFESYMEELRGIEEEQDDSE